MMPLGLGLLTPLPGLKRNVNPSDPRLRHGLYSLSPCRGKNTPVPLLPMPSRISYAPPRPPRSAPLLLAGLQALQCRLLERLTCDSAEAE